MIHWDLGCSEVCSRKKDQFRADIYIYICRTNKHWQRKGDKVRENRTKVVQGLRQNYNPSLISILDFWSSLSLDACRTGWLSSQIVSMYSCLCSVIIFAYLKGTDITWTRRWNHSFHLKPHFEIYFFLPYCVEISPPLILSISSSPTSKRAALQRAVVAPF